MVYIIPVLYEQHLTLSHFFIELDLHTKCVVDVDANKVILHPINTNLSKGDGR